MPKTATGNPTSLTDGTRLALNGNKLTGRCLHNPTGTGTLGSLQEGPNFPKIFAKLFLHTPPPDIGKTRLSVSVSLA